MATAIKRVIKFDGKTLADIPGMSSQQLKTHYARIYPELTTATVEEEVAAGSCSVVFTTGAKTKG